MRLHWIESIPSNVSDVITDFRLNNPANSSSLQDGDNVWWSTLIDLRDTSLDAFEVQLKTRFEGNYIIPNDYSPEERARHEDEQIVTLFARRPVLDALNQVDNLFGVSTVSLGAIVPSPTLNHNAPDRLPAGMVIEVPENTVTMAVIDDGLAFAHDLFRKGPTESRVESMYIMASRALPEDPFYTLGRQIDRTEIDSLLAKNTHSGLLDEERFYEQAGMIDHAGMSFSSVSQRRSHGSHVMAQAAGYEMGSVHSLRPILGVQLPSRVTADVSGQTLYPSLLSAIRFVRRKAKQHVTTKSSKSLAPLVVNFSYGNFGGPHDGTSLISRLIDHSLKSSKDQEVRAVLPAGNANLARCHATASFSHPKIQEPAVLDLNVLPDDHTCSYVQMWMPFSTVKPLPDFVHVRVTPPNGLQSAATKARAGSRQILLNDDDEIIAELVYSFEGAPTCRGVITLMLNPTASQAIRSDLAPSGRWKIEIEKVDIKANQTIEIWIRRDETLPGYPPFGRQASFNNPDYERFDTFGAPLATDPPNSNCPVKRAGTLSGFATGSVPVVIGGFTQSDGLLSDYSAAGPITATREQPIANRNGPDASARSDDSPVLSGVLGAGSRSGCMVRMNGTSVAAPLVARYIADALAKGEDADRKWIARRAAESDRKYFPLPKPADTRTGSGRLELDFPFKPKNAEV